MPNHDFDWMLRALKALADASRLKLLGILASRECSVEELAGALGLKAPTVSHHLSRLRDADLVRMRADGNTHLYRMNESGLNVIRSSLGDGERVAGLASDVSLDGFEENVFRSFVSGDALLRIPASRKKRQVILRWLVDFFEDGVDYEERHVNEELKRHHWDCATLRREFIAGKLMERHRGVYRRLPVADRITD